MTATDGKTLLVTGGVGGARLCDGFNDLLPSEKLLVVVNVGDDFEHCGLYICPDIDSTVYTLAGVSDRDRGWGRSDESWVTLHTMEALNGPAWFQLGDKDLAVHLYRTELLRVGKSLSEATRILSGAMGVNATVIPVTDQPVRTVVHSNSETLTFQEYFVKEKCQPPVHELAFHGAREAALPAVLANAFSLQLMERIFICPSNPFVSIGPMLAIPAFAEALRGCATSVIAVSPIIGGKAVKGPAAEMLRTMGYKVNAAGVARYYAETAPGVIDTFVVDESDVALVSEIGSLGFRVEATDILMRDQADRERLASYLWELH